MEPPRFRPPPPSSRSKTSRRRSVAEGEAGQLFLERLQLCLVRGSGQPARDCEEVLTLAIVSVESDSDEIRHGTARTLVACASKGLHAPEHDRREADAEADLSVDSHRWNLHQQPEDRTSLAARTSKTR